MKCVAEILPIRCKETRALQNMTQQYLAERMGVHHTYISQIENGKRLPSCQNLANLAEALHQSSAFLLGIHEYSEDATP